MLKCPAGAPFGDPSLICLIVKQTLGSRWLDPFAASDEKAWPSECVRHSKKRVLQNPHPAWDPPERKKQKQAQIRQALQKVAVANGPESRRDVEESRGGPTAPVEIAPPHIID